VKIFQRGDELRFTAHWAAEWRRGEEAARLPLFFKGGFSATVKVAHERGVKVTPWIPKGGPKFLLVGATVKREFGLEEDALAWQAIYGGEIRSL